uniref:Uncharacterized protein n=1 Tax=Corethron hystrix TaxID=216773 RepID=A0A7S1BEM2_9STRA|mmetsp:Transcript_22280/g.51038  ORF Transcript_22280/g.51038 Transcript_22280/m.51038 type:complete len:566 (+) Transcript_22280:152-1849(+)
MEDLSKLRHLGCRKYGVFALRLIFASLCLSTIESDLALRNYIFTTGKHELSSKVVDDYQSTQGLPKLSKAVRRGEKINQFKGTSIQQRQLGNNYNNRIDDFSLFSMKFARCQTVIKYDENYIENYGTPLIKEDVVLYRLCPSNQCSDESSWQNPYGCQDGFGEYALSLNEYLEQKSYFLNDVEQGYCEYCAENGCANNGDDDEKNQQDDDGQNEEEDGGQDQRLLEEDNEDQGDGNDEGDDENDGDEEKDGDDYAFDCNDNCADYEETCNGYSYNKVDPRDYFGCVEYASADDDSIYYIGPVCTGRSANFDSDIKIALGVFSDENCLNYVGDEIILNEYTGIYFPDDLLEDYYDSSCQSCSDMDDKKEDNEDDGNANDDAYGICESVYDISQKCDKWVNEDQIYNTDVCVYLENIASGQYNGEGEIYQDMRYHGQRTYHSLHMDKRVTALQIVFVYMLLLANVIALCCIIFLRRQIHLYSTIKDRSNPLLTLGKLGRISRVAPKYTESLDIFTKNSKESLMPWASSIEGTLVTSGGSDYWKDNSLPSDVNASIEESSPKPVGFFL